VLPSTCPSPSFFLLRAPPPTAFYPLSLHDALPICVASRGFHVLTPVAPSPPGSIPVSAMLAVIALRVHPDRRCGRDPRDCAGRRSEEHTSELQSRENLVCRLLLEKKNIWVADAQAH